MVSAPFLLYFLLSNSFHLFSCSEVVSTAVSAYSGPFLDSNGPKYYGQTQADDYPIDCDYFTRNTLVNFDNQKKESLFSSLPDDSIVNIFEYLQDFRLIFSSKLLFRLTTKYLTYRLFHFNPQIFWLLPPSTRLHFLLRFLKFFEEHFPGIKGNVNLTRDELSGLLFLALHVNNPLYISRSSIDYIRACNPYFFTSETSNDSFYNPPFHCSSIWLTIILSRFIKKNSFFCIEAACKADPAKIKWAIELIVHKIGFSEQRWHEKISGSMISLLTRLIYLVPQESAVKFTLNTLLTKSIAYETISTFDEFLPLWTFPSSEIGKFDEDGNLITIADEHILYSIAHARLTSVSLLERPDLSEEVLAKSLKICKNIGNGLLATDLITKFEPNTFSFFFDPQLIFILRQALQNQNSNLNLNLSAQTSINLAILIASFHFQQTHMIDLFRRLIRGQELSEQVLNELKGKRTLQFYDLSIQHRERNNCIIS